MALDTKKKDWFKKEQEKLAEQIREEMSEAVSNVQILNQNLDHLNDLGKEIINVSSIWVKFLKGTTKTSEEPEEEDIPNSEEESECVNDGNVAND